MTSELGATIAFGILAALLILMGKRRGFFVFPQAPWTVPLNVFQVLGAFAIYFSSSFLFLALAIRFLKTQIQNNYLGYASWLNFSISLSIFIFLVIYLFLLPEIIRKGIWSRPLEKHSIAEDFWLAIVTWMISFPLVLFFSQITELLVTKIFHVTQLPDQIAVKFLKSTFDHPVYFSLAVISIIFLAPLVEETLFRGFLQTYIRRNLGPKQAILITSFCFSLFHYASGQGLGNISIIPSLFVFSLFLGFIYEKQGSLLASMALHGIFNLVSVVNLYLFGGFTTGL